MLAGAIATVLLLQLDWASSLRAQAPRRGGRFLRSLVGPKVIWDSCNCDSFNWVRRGWADDRENFRVRRQARRIE